VAERIVVGDEEPAVATALHHFLRGSDRQRTGIKDPLHRIGRAEFAMEVRSTGGVSNEQLLLFGGDVLHANPTADTGTSTIRSICSVSYQRRARPAPISGLS